MTGPHRGMRAFRARVRKVRRSRAVFHWIAGVAFVIWLVSIAIVAINQAVTNEDPIAPFTDVSRSVAVGTESADTFEGRETTIRPFFSICPQGSGQWKVVFSWTITSALGTAASTPLPPLYMIVPSDSTDITPEKGVVYDNETGETKYTQNLLTEVDAVRTVDKHTVLRLTSGQLTVDNERRTVAYYGVNFVTSAFDLGQSSFGERNFKVSYNPGLATTYRLTPGFGRAIPPSRYGDRDLGVLTCDSDHLDGHEFLSNTLEPVPTREISRGRVIWDQSSSSEITIFGRTRGGFVHDVYNIAEWAALNAFAAGLGALYGAGIEPPMDEKNANQGAATPKPAPPTPQKGNAKTKPHTTARSRKPRRWGRR